jgi:hypothetical protein
MNHPSLQQSVKSVYDMLIITITLSRLEDGTQEASHETMTSHERFSRIYAHKDADRIPISDQPWRGTISAGIVKVCRPE